VNVASAAVHVHGEGESSELIATAGTSGPTLLVRLDNLTTCDSISWIFPICSSMVVCADCVAYALVATRVSSPRRGVPMRSLTSATEKEGLESKYESFVSVHCLHF
jgi:hypothetical protein